MAGLRRSGLQIPVDFALENKVENGIAFHLVAGRESPIGALAAESLALRVAGNLRGFLAVAFRLAEHDPRSLPLGRVGEKQAARLEAAFVLAELADVEDIAGPQRQPVEARAVAGVGMFTTAADVDLADAVPLPLGNVVHKIELAGFFQKPRIGLDVGKHEAASAVDVADKTEISVHLLLVERLTALEFQIASEEVLLELAIADKGDVAD